MLPDVELLVRHALSILPVLLLTDKRSVMSLVGLFLSCFSAFLRFNAMKMFAFIEASILVTWSELNWKIASPHSDFLKGKGDKLTTKYIHDICLKTEIQPKAS
jgi:hypothetical protein